MVDGQVAPEPLRAEACHVQGDRAIHPQAQDSALDPAMIIEMLRHFQGENTLLSDDEVSLATLHHLFKAGFVPSGWYGGLPLPSGTGAF